MNDRFFTSLGTTRTEYLKYQYHILDRFDEENQAAFLNMLDEAAKTGSEASRELRSKPISGLEELWTEARVRLLAHKANSKIYYLALENISERMKLFLHNKELGAQLSALIASVPGGVMNFEITDKTRLTYFNDMTAQMLGYTRAEYAEAFSENPFAAVHPEDVEAVRHAVKRMLRGETHILSYKYRHVYRDGTWRWIQITGKVVRREEGRIMTSVILIDIDDQMQKDLQQYSNALFGAYDEVLQLNLEQNSLVSRASKTGRYTPGQVHAFDQMTEQICKEVVLPEYAEEMARFLDPVRISETVSVTTIEYRYWGQNGEACWARGTLLHALSYVYFICINDVSDEKKCRERLSGTVPRRLRKRS